MKSYFFYLIIILFLIFYCNCKDSELSETNIEKAPKKNINLEKGLYAELKTKKGNVLINLFFKKVPLSVSNFIGLAEGLLKNSEKKPGVPFYNGVTFHRVVKNFVIQSGDPKGDGEGGPGYSFPIEIHPDLNHDSPGTVGMARDSDPNSNGSQFYITHRATPHLDGAYIVFGKVIKGLKTINKIEKGDILKTVKIIRIGKEANDFKVNDITFLNLKKNQTKKNQTKIEKNKFYINKRIDQILQILKEQKKIKTKNGLAYIILRKGQGEKIKENVTHKAKYIGFTKDKSLIESSYLKLVPYLFRLQSENLKIGLKESYKDMRQGEKRVVVIPPHLNIKAKEKKEDLEKISMIYELELIL